MPQPSHAALQLKTRRRPPASWSGGACGRPRRARCAARRWARSGGRLRISGRRYGVAGDLDEGAEGCGLRDRQLGEVLAVDLDAGGLQTLDEAVVGHAVGAGGGVDPLDPQRAEVALARATVAIRVVERVEHLLLRLAVEPGPLAAVAAGPLENDATLFVGVDRPLYACHGRTPCIIRREAPVGTGSRSAAEHLLGLLDVGRRELLDARETASARRRLVLEVVPAVGALAQELAGPSDLEPLLRTAVRLHLGHCCLVSSLDGASRIASGLTRLERLAPARAQFQFGGAVVAACDEGPSP